MAHLGVHPQDPQGVPLLLLKTIRGGLSRRAAFRSRKPGQAEGVVRGTMRKQQAVATCR